MTKRKKRNAVTLVSLLLALAALIGAYIWYGNRDTEKENSGATSDIPLATVDTSKVTTLHYIGSDVDMKLVRKEGVWKSEEEPERPINQKNVTSMIDTIKEIKAYQKVTDSAKDLAEFGMDKPAAFIEVTLEDGKTISLRLGSQAITGDGYYAIVNDETKVYLVGMTYKSGLSFTNTDMTEIMEAPTITAENITYINIDSRDGEDVELKYNEKAKLDYSGSLMYQWQILKPYGDGYTADDSKVAEIQANYSKFDFLDCVDYKGEDLSKYGLNNPTATIDIGYFDTVEPSITPKPTTAVSNAANTEAEKINKEYKILIGDKNDKGDYYVKSDGSNAVYTLSGSSVDKMLQVDVFSLLNKNVLLPNIQMVDQVSVNINGKQYQMEIKPIVTKDTSKDEDAEATYYFQGKEVKEEDFKKLYQTMLSTQYDAILKEEVDISKLRPVLTLSYHLFGDYATTVTASFLPYNDSFYITDIGKGLNFLADKRYIDQIIEAITEFQ